MIVTREEARRIALLARLAMDEPTLDRMTGEMTAILDYIDQLREVDVSSVEVVDVDPSALRVDEIAAGRERLADAIAANAPAWRDGLFVVPKVIGGE